MDFKGDSDVEDTAFLEGELFSFLNFLIILKIKGNVTLFSIFANKFNGVDFDFCLGFLLNRI